MKYQITSDNIQMSPSMETLAKDKMKKLETRLAHVYDDLKSFRIVMNSIPDQQFLVKIHSVVHGKEYFVEEKGYTLENALVQAIDDLERQLIKAHVIKTTEDWEQAREAKRFDPDTAIEE